MRCCSQAQTQLEDIWINDNQISGLDDALAGLAPCAATLTTVYLGGNPAAGEAGYRQRVKAALPALSQLDDRAV